MKKIFVYAGNWNVQSEFGNGGIGIYEYCEGDGSLRHIETIRPEITPGMIHIDEKRGVLYTIDEQMNHPDFGMQGGGGRVLAFSIDHETGSLTELGEAQPAFGTLTSYVAEDPMGSWLIVTNHGDDQPIMRNVKDIKGHYHVQTEYSDVTAVLYPIAENGEILPAKEILSFPENRDICPVRTACLHGAWFSPNGAFCLITNMKQDRIVMFDLDKENGQLHVSGELKCQEGIWPRYAVFHPQKRLIYVNCERSLQILVLRYDENGKIELLKSVSAVPEISDMDKKKRISQSDLKISADGRYLYDFYRYTDAAAVFEINQEDGMPEMIQSMTVTEKRPRGAAISPDGRFMLVANITGGIAVMKIEEDGKLTETGIVDRSMCCPGSAAFYQSTE